MDDADAIFRRQFERRAGPRFAVRTAAREDQAFLAHLLRRVRAESIERLGGDASHFVSGPLDELQFNAQSLAYRSAYPLASDYIVLRREDERPIGRALIDWANATPAVILVDLAVLPEARAGAVGIHLLRALSSTCDRTGQKAELHVTPHNPARRLYRRIGFVETESLAFPIPMCREPR
jgi:ribosomal protein S18 acetylase RimI-like enzyme